jgi:3-oxoacyl-[acyl-carrier-protein] synthase-3
MRNAVIISSGAYAPERVLDNLFFNELLGEDVDSWLRVNVEIFERRWCSSEQSTADLCEHAAILCLKNASLDPESIDLIIIATDTPEYISPSTAAIIQDRIKAVNAGTFDINTACAGFVTALDMASKYIQADDSYRNILVIGGYAMSKYLNMADKKTVTLFADGAGAVLLQAQETETTGQLVSMLKTKGEYNEWMGIYGGGSKYPVTAERISRHEHQLAFVRKFPKELNAEVWTAMIKEMCLKAKISPDNISHYILTQINVHTIRETMDRLNQAHEKAVEIMHNFGYTGSACIPMAFHTLMESGKINKGDIICFLGSGGGLAFAGTIFRY